uniref:Beta-ketoacyl synthase n=1 Tax=Cyanothece sp. (strain PCC 7425 / ATCC 29141) TaxID=395961 RepID=B8HKZ3_CYAP4
MATLDSGVVTLAELPMGVVQITLQDREHCNAFSEKLIRELTAAFKVINNSNVYKVVLLTGYDTYFASGGTKEFLHKIQQGELRWDFDNFYRLLIDCKLPVIAAMQGHGIGGGFVFGLSADVIFLSRESIYTANFMKYGFTPGFGASLILPERLGKTLAAEMMLTAREYRGLELAERGISLRVLSRREVLNEAKNFANQLADKPQLSLILLKQHLVKSLREGLPAVIQAELAMHDQTLGQPEVQERIESQFLSAQIQKQTFRTEVGQQGANDRAKTKQEQIEILTKLSQKNLSISAATQLLLRTLKPEHIQPINNQKRTDKPQEPQDQNLSQDQRTGVTSDLNSQDIAIIGISCRYPGAKDWEAFWHNLTHGIDTIAEVSDDRWSEWDWYHPDPAHLGTATSRRVGFIDYVDQFDPQFFQIAPAEAVFIDPQQRILLEETYHALEDAGYTLERLQNQPCGVFIGASTGDYNQILSDAGLGTHRHALTGNSAAILSGRIAYFFNLKGVTMTIDTSCSSSLVAVHQAAESLRSGDSNLAIAGGITLMLTPRLHILTSQAGMTSKHGHCKTFDAEAAGTVFSEGCGVVILKRLEEAIRDRDQIYAVIKGSGVNQDGSTNGITAPSVYSQIELEKKVYDRFQIDPGTIGYVEAHGTGTPLGDPIEWEALTTVFSSYTERQHFCAVGSAKTNIGHTAYAAGVAGLIKAALCLKFQQLVPSLHFQIPNPHLQYEQSPLYVNTHLKAWPAPEDHPRRAAVSSFGFSGTNAHLVLEEAPAIAADRVNEPKAEKQLYLLTLSAKTEATLADMVANYQTYLNSHPDLKLADLAYTTNVGRSHFNHRLAIITSSKQDLQAKLSALQENSKTTGYFGTILPSGSSCPQLAMLFTGQGSQYVGMGQQLYQTQSIFKQALDHCAEIINPYLDQPLLEILYPDSREDSRLHQTAYTQPALFAIEYGLYQLWQSWGIQPNAVMGHSVGEYVAACVAGVFSLEDGLKLIAARSQLMQQLPTGGAMVSVMAGVERVRSVINCWEDLAIAAINGPTSTVLSGAAQAVEAGVGQLEAQGIKVIPLQVSHAFHSPLMEPMIAAFEQVARQISYTLPRIKLISNLTGKVATAEIATAEYWCQHILAPVNFAAGMETLHQQGCEVFLECGPKPILLGMGQQCLPPQTGAWLPSLKTGQQDGQQLLSSLAELYGQGFAVNWLSVNPTEPQQLKVSLPTYPFQRQRYWVDRKPAQTRALSSQSVLHPLLGQRLHLAGRSQEIIFEHHLSANYPAYLLDHDVVDKVVVPGAAYVEMALAAGRHLFQSSSLVLENVFIAQPLVLSPIQTTTVQMVLTPEADQSYHFEIASLNESPNSQTPEWQVHVSAQLRAGSGAPLLEQVELQAWQKRGTPLSPHLFYEQSRQHGITLGPCFQSLTQAWLEQGQGQAQVQLPTAIAIHETSGYQIHPVLLDGVFQLAAAMVAQAVPLSQDSLYLPVAIERLEIYGPVGAQVWVEANHLRERVDGNVSSTLKFVSESGTVLGRIEGFTLRSVSRQTLQRMLEPNLEDWLYSVEWRKQARLNRQSDPDVFPAPAEVVIAQARPESTLPSAHGQGHWLILADQQGMADRVADRLREQGATCTLVRLGQHTQLEDDTTLTLAAQDSASYQQLLADLATQAHGLQGIIHCWSLDSPDAQLVDSSKLDALSQLGCGTLLLLVQALIQQKEIDLPRLWIVTRGTQPAGAKPHHLSGIAQSSLWGLAKVIRLEHPELLYTCVDLDSHSSVNEQAENLWSELGAGEVEDQVAWRSQGRYVARLVRSSLSKSVSSSLDRSEGTYLITGGLGGLGLLVAEWLVKHYRVRHLVLVNRRQPTSEVQSQLKALTNRGIQVTVTQADVSDDEAMAAVLASIRQSPSPLKGIVHMAGVLDDSTLVHQNWQKFATVMAAKVQGAWNLHQLTLTESLDFFILFSSAASLLGSPGQANYSAANAFLDGLAHYRQSLGLPGQSYHLGAVAQVGQAAKRGADLRSQQQGIGAIQPQQVLLILERLLQQPEMTEVSLVPIDWRSGKLPLQWQEWPYLSDWFVNKQDQEAIQKSDFSQRLRTASASEYQPLLTAYIKKQAAQLLGIANWESLSAEHSFMELGMDSLTLMELRNRLQKELSVSISTSTLIEYPTVKSLVTHIQAQILIAPKTGISKVSRQAEKLSFQPELTNTIGTKTQSSLLVRLNRDRVRPPLFCCVGLGSYATYFSELAQCMGSKQAVYGLQPAGLDGSAKPQTQVEALAQDYIQAIQSIQPTGPYLLCGHSMGAIVAYEIAQQLLHQNQEISSLILIDPITPNHLRQTPFGEDELVDMLGVMQKVLKVEADLDVDKDKLSQLSMEEQVKALFQALKQFSAAPLQAEENFTLWSEQFQASLIAYKQYFPKKIKPVKTILFKPAENVLPRLVLDSTPQIWKNLTGSLDYHTVSGDHFTMLKAPHVQNLAQMISACIDRLE